MIYNTANPIDAQKARKRLDELMSNRKRIELRECTNRSADQNALFHVWCWVMAQEWGYDDLEDAKDIIVGNLLGYDSKLNPITGEVEQFRRRTSKLTKEAFSSLLDTFKRWAQLDFNTYLPYWKDAGYNEMMEAYSRKNG